MKKVLFLAVLAFLVVSVALVSAGVGNEATVVGGTIYKDNDITYTVSGADVEVICNENTETTTSGSDGEYSVTFASTECECEDDVTVSAEKDGLTGSNSGSITMCDLKPFPSLELDVGIVNVPLIPEFGLLVGVLTILSAVGIFFVIRRK